jgi:mannosyltransferase
MRRGLFIAGLCVGLMAIGMPAEWYDSIPQNPDLPPPPLSGLTLLRLSFIAEAVLLIGLALRRRATLATAIPQITTSRPLEQPERIGRATALSWLAGITLLALILRVWRLDSEMWLDEIATLVAYGQLSVAQVMASYLGSNNHLLNTLLVKLSVATLGEHEWSVRLPAVLFGTATVPLFYWTARRLCSRANSLAAALLLAVSYHHIFFSQNARGYTAYIFFSLLSSVLFCRALSDGRVRSWGLYAGAAILNMASLLIGAFVLASHVAASLAILVMLHRTRRPLHVMAWTFAAVFAITGFLVFQLYAMVLPQAYVYLTSVYTRAASGYGLLSSDFLTELERGLVGGFGTRIGWGVVPILVLGLSVGALGFLRLVRRDWPLMVTLTLPGVFTGVAAALGGLTVSPRFFLLALPLAILVAVEVLDAGWQLLAGRSSGALPAWGSLASAAVISALLLLPLGRYYAIPKQPYLASAEYLRRELGPDDAVVFVHLTESGFRYYGPRFGFEEGTQCVYLRSQAALEAVLRSHRRGRILLVTTFPRLLRLEYPGLASLIDREWKIAQTFQATIGDGDIAIWIQK